MKQLILILSSLVLAFGAQAYQVEPSESEFKWTGKKVTGSHYGTLPIQSSKVEAKDGKILGGEFILDITKMTVGDLKGGMAKKFLDHMKSADFFNVTKWPTARLEIKKLDGKQAFGTLYIKDKSNPVQFPYTKKGELFSGTLKFDRTRFGMVYGSGDFFKGLGDKMIYNDVTIEFKVKLKKSTQKMAQAK